MGGGCINIRHFSAYTTRRDTREILPSCRFFAGWGGEGPIGTCRKMRCEPVAGAGGELRVSSFCHATEPSHDRAGHHAPFFVAFFFAALAADDA